MTTPVKRRAWSSVDALCTVTWRLVGAGSASVDHVVVCSVWVAARAGFSNASSRRPTKLSNAWYAAPQWLMRKPMLKLLGQYAFGGTWGRHLVMMLTTLELMGSNTMCLIILQQQVELFLSSDGVGCHRLCHHTNAHMVHRYLGIVSQACGHELERCGYSASVVHAINSTL